MLPPIGSVSILPSHGRAGVVLDARPLGDAENGRQLVALRIKAEASDADSAKAGSKSYAPNGQILPSGGQVHESSHGLPTSSASSSPVAAKLPDQLSAAERTDLAKLQQRDQQVRQEEKAHAAVAGDLAGPISYVYQRGPDGRQYAVGGSVSVQASSTSGDPLEAKRLSGRLAAAAHAATSPSAQDLAVARQAYQFGSQLSAPVQEEGRDHRINSTF